MVTYAQMNADHLELWRILSLKLQRFIFQMIKVLIFCIAHNRLRLCVCQ